jgi:hypothetical protein
MPPPSLSRFYYLHGFPFNRKMTDRSLYLAVGGNNEPPESIRRGGQTNRWIFSMRLLQEVL